MSDKVKTKNQLLDEIAELRRRNDELEKMKFGAGQPQQEGEANTAGPTGGQSDRDLFNEELFRLFVENGPAISWIKDDQGRHVYLSKNYEKTFGVKLQDWKGKTDFELWPPETANCFRDNDNAVLSSGRVMEVYEETTLPDGTVKTWWNFKIPFTDPAGHRYIAGIGIDITGYKKAEDTRIEVQKQNDLLISVMTNSSQAWGMGYPDGRIGMVNRAFEELTGYTADELRSIDWTETLTPAKYRAPERAHMQELERTGQPVRYEKEYIRKNGSCVPVELLCHVVRDEQGAAEYYYSFVTDLTDRKRAEEALVASRNELQNVINGAASLIYALDTEERFLFANKALAELLDTSPEELIGKRRHEFIPDEFANWHEENDRQVIKQGRVLEFEEHGPAGRDGHIITWLTTKFPLRDSQGKIYGVAGISADITERKKAKDELERRVEERTANLQKAMRDVTQERRRLYEVLEALPVMICLLTPDYRVAFANRSFREKFGESEDRHCYEYCFGFEAPCLFCESFEPLKTGKPHHWEVTAPDGSTIDAYDFPFIDVDGSPMVLEMDVDITERRKLEEQLRQAHKMEAIGTLAGGIAHDFNNILAAIIGFTEMAVDDVSDRPLVQKNLQNVMTSAMRAKELVKQILAFSRKTAFDRAPIALFPLVEETVKLLRASIPATVDITLSDNASSDTVVAAPVEVQQIIMNLATNALLAMPDRRGYVEISLSDVDFEPDALALDSAAREYIQTIVKDSGVGMDPEVMKRIFEPFYTTRDVGKGSGMGLAVIYGIVKDLGGTITVESKPGEGSTFRVFLPKAIAEINEEIRQSHAAHGAERILFVDDEPLLLEWGKLTLEKLGYTVTVVSGARQALKIFAADPSMFDLIITDQAMPGMPGSELCIELLRIRKDIPIILTTGHSETVSPEKAGEIGIRGFLMKPVTRQELSSAIRRALRGNDQ